MIVSRLKINRPRYDALVKSGSAGPVPAELVENVRPAVLRPILEYYQKVADMVRTGGVGFCESPLEYPGDDTFVRQDLFSCSECLPFFGFCHFVESQICFVVIKSPIAGCPIILIKGGGGTQIPVMSDFS